MHGETTDDDDMSVMRDDEDVACQLIHVDCELAERSAYFSYCTVLSARRRRGEARHHRGTVVVLSAFSFFHRTVLVR